MELFEQINSVEVMEFLYPTESFMGRFLTEKTHLKFSSGVVTRKYVRGVIIFIIAFKEYFLVK